MQACYEKDDFLSSVRKLKLDYFCRTTSDIGFTILYMSPIFGLYGIMLGVEVRRKGICTAEFEIVQFWSVEHIILRLSISLLILMIA